MVFFNSAIVYLEARQWSSNRKKTQIKEKVEYNYLLIPNI